MNISRLYGSNYRMIALIAVVLPSWIGCAGVPQPPIDAGVNGRALPDSVQVGRNPNSLPAGPDIVQAPPADGVETISVPVVIHEPLVSQQTKASAAAVVINRPNLVVMDEILPRSQSDQAQNQTLISEDASEILVNQSTKFMQPTTAEQPLAPPVVGVGFNSLNFDDNAVENNSYNIPPDSDSAVGTHHVVLVTNTMIRFHDKDGTVVFTDALSDFFSSESPQTNTFDPKVLFDPIEGRFVVVTLEIEDDGVGGNAETSKIFVAVSDDANPIGGWCTITINGKTFIDDSERWADYPGFALDEEAVYITANMFGFDESGEDTSVGVRLWIIEKGAGSGGFYDCGTTSITKHDPLTSGALNTTLQPAQMHGAMPAGVGTFLVGYSGLSGEGDEFAQIIRIDDPLGATNFTAYFSNLGDIEDFASFSGAPQKDEVTPLDVGNRRTLDAEWYDNSLWFTASISPKAGDTDAGEITAHWWEFDTSANSVPVLAQQGNIFGDDLETDLWTYYPSVAVSGNGQAGFGFSGSSAGIYAGSYYTVRNADDAVGVTQGTALLKGGEGPYLRTFCGGDNRWGDYSSTDVDPVNGAFWFFNQHALTTGVSLVSCPGESGRWGTYAGRIFPDNPLPIDQWLEDMELTQFWVSAYATRTGPNVIIPTGADTTIIAGSLVKFGPGFTVDNGAALSVLINP